MGTTWSVVLNAPDLSREGRGAAQAAVQSALDDVNAAMSTWDAASEISRFNAVPSSEAVAFSPATFSVLRLAQEVSASTGGAFDVTVGPLVAAWGFGAGARVPGDPLSEEELGALMERVGWERLHLDSERSSARKLHPSLEIDLSAVAKGFGVDQAAAALEALGHVDYLIEVGGELRVRGVRPDGGNWRVGIERPTSQGRSLHAVVELEGMAMATSGDYRNFREQDGARITHIIDPRTGRPAANRVASVSVVHERAAVADAWATALTVLGAEEGQAKAEASGIAAYFLLHGPGDGVHAVAAPSFPAVEVVAEGSPAD